MSSKKQISKSGWNWEAFFKSFVWYSKKGMSGYATIMAGVILVTVGIGLIPVMLYSGFNANKDFYNHVKKASFII